MQGTDNMEQGKKGVLVVISGPAGSGKGTVISHIMKTGEDYAYSVSATTRQPRPGEIDGKSYYFISREDFEKRLADDMMLEHTEYCGNYYGTPCDKVLEQLKTKNVILEIEVEGAMQVKDKFPEATLILLLPPDFKTLEARLRGRHTETEEVVLKRLEKAKNEVSFFDKYDYIVINNDGGAELAARQIINIINSEKQRTARCMEVKEHFYD